MRVIEMIRGLVIGPGIFDPCLIFIKETGDLEDGDAEIHVIRGHP